MTVKVSVLQPGAGIQRDGTQFASGTYVDGKWVRFQYNRPRKIGGYRGVFLNASGISRGMIMSSQDGLNYVVSGYSNGLQQWITNNTNAVGSGPSPILASGPILAISITNQGSSYTNGTYTSVPITASVGSGALATVTVSSNLVFSVVITAAGSGYTIGESVNISAASIGGTGSGFAGYVLSLTNYSPDSNTLWQFDLGFDAYGTGQNQLIAHPGENLNDISSTVNSRPMVGLFTGNTVAPVGIFTATGTLTSGSPTVTFATTNIAIGPGVSVTGAGIPANTTVVSAQTIAGVWTATLSANATASGANLLTFDNNISVSGGVVMLFPYLFVYGNNGLIQNCSAGNFNDWTSSDSNANNVSSTKVIKGLPIRGGTTSPAGLFWTLDSVVRVTYSPQTVGTSTLYWRYDLITQQSSIMSSQCVIEYDGIFYWVGTDRFLTYNGVVQEVKNTQNMNYFFDNLNFSQRQKVWVSKVPRWGEIWWFYPKGDSVECNDAIIYNVRDQVWYDAGQALGARRSAGVFSEVFLKPIWGGWDQNGTGGYTLWQQETGSNQIYTNQVDAIESYFETNVIGSGQGLVGSSQAAGDNLWTRCERVEPDFVQVGTMSLVVTGKGYADDIDAPSAPYPFDPTTLKIDMKEQRREMRMRFISNTQDGDYYMGRVLMNIESGDVRGTGNP
jgi:hypothetical protein